VAGGSSVVQSAAELVEALQSGVGEIEVRGTLSGMPMVTLPPGVRLRGGTLKFGAIIVGGQVRTSADNVITLELDGHVGQIEIAGGVAAQGKPSDAVHARGAVPGLAEVAIMTANGLDFVRTA